MYTPEHEKIDELFLEDFLASLLTDLSDRHRTVLILRIYWKYTQKQVAEYIKVSPERIGQIEQRALRILRTNVPQEKWAKIAIPWIDNLFLSNARRKKEEHKQILKQSLAYEEKLAEEREEQRKLTQARQKLVLLNETIHVPEELVIQHMAPKKSLAPLIPPAIVKIQFDASNTPYLQVDPMWGYIDRNVDPETYDNWLKYLMQKS